ncbi:MAG: sugar ABC transporter substrate-binding protein, partial [Chloroflexi bacterium]
MNVQRRVMVSLALVLSLVLAACGGSPTPPAAQTSAAPAQSVAAASEPAAAAAAPATAASAE